MRHCVYLSPGMFGFGKLGSYEYFTHLARELTARFAGAGHELEIQVIEDLPTASIRRRATRLAAIVARTATGDAPIHLLGHSTGGLDARLVASPATRAIPDDSLAWLPRLRSVTTMNTPHFGTPLASFFATASGERVLAALSMLTVAGLALGKEPLAAASLLLGFMRGGESSFPFKLAILDRSVASVLGLVDDARAPEVRQFLDSILDDQGSMLQLSPEAMDLVVAGMGDRPGVAYQSTASMAVRPGPRRWIEAGLHPWRAVSLSLFFALQRITAAHHPHYPCAAMRETTAWSGEANEAILARALGESPPLSANDGIVPIRSQLWGRVVWAGLGDHLDVLGHYRDTASGDELAPELRHRDWLTSGADFGARQFGALVDAIAGGMLAAA